MNLENLSEFTKLDTQNMFEMVFKWPELIQEVYSTDISIPSTIEIGKYKLKYKVQISHVMICGMGGSAVSGDYIKTYFEKSLTTPFTVQRNYYLPKYVDSSSLVIVISYSGNTEETISSLISAIKSGCPIVFIGTGGKIGEFCSKTGIPFFKIPSGYQPRASFPLLLFPILKILKLMKIIQFKDSILTEIIEQLKTLRMAFMVQQEGEKNYSKTIALKLFNKIPIIWSSHLCVANRFKNQINENSKQLALAEELPEFNHNHIIGFEGLSRDNPYIIVAYRFPSEHPNVSLRYEISKGIIENKVEIIELKIQNGDLLTQLVNATYIGDYISMYLAILNGKDPSTVESIDFLKKELQTRGKTQTALFMRLNSLLV
ncbi:MAG: bifunctional phosphoglucose/phosphomannose isomerase [Candidatus Hodarchaeales archaeon]